MRNYARTRAQELLDRLEGELERTEHSHDAEAIHDLRVSIRRLSRCLRAFSQFFPRGARKQARRRLAGLMDRAAEVRDRDIALELFAAAGIPARAAAAVRLRRERSDSGRELLEEVGRWRQRGVAAKLARELEV